MEFGANNNKVSWVLFSFSISRIKVVSSRWFVFFFFVVARSSFGLLYSNITHVYMMFLQHSSFGSKYFKKFSLKTFMWIIYHTLRLYSKWTNYGSIQTLSVETNLYIRRIVSFSSSILPLFPFFFLHLIP